MTTEHSGQAPPGEGAQNYPGVSSFLAPQYHQPVGDETSGPTAPTPTAHQGALYDSLWPALDHVVTTNLFDFLPGLSDDNSMDPFTI